jgi:hypothetical protein
MVTLLFHVGRVSSGHVRGQPLDMAEEAGCGTIVTVTLLALADRGAPRG